MSDTLGWGLGWVVVGCPFYYEFNQLCNNIVYVKKIKFYLLSASPDLSYARNANGESIKHSIRRNCFVSLQKQ